MEALVVAIATLVRVSPESTKEAFMSAYPKNVETWDETALFLPVTDEWKEGLTKTAAKLLRIARS
jgi:hypothetical protein